MYEAANVEYTLKVKRELAKLADYGLDKLAVCIAKTQQSLSDKHLLKGRPTGFTLNIRDLEITSGAGFIVPIAGSILCVCRDYRLIRLPRK